MTTLAFLLDVDNTLLANDSVKKDFDAHLQVEIGPQLTQRFWELYEQARHERGVVDIPLALNRLRERVPESELDEQTYEHVRSIFENYPFQKALYPHALDVLRYLSTLGTTVIVSDGDIIFQADKIVSSNLADAVAGRVLLYIHKQDHLDEIMKEYPADHYVMIDDKPQILVDSKAALGEQLTTLFVEQGKYAQQKPEHFQPDLTVSHIADVCKFSAEQFLSAAKTA